MARKRTIDPAIWGDDAFSALSLGARVLYMGMLSHADDEGRLSGAPRELKNRIFPGDGALTLSDIESMRGELTTSKLIVCYAVAGKVYVTISGWEKHQKVRWVTPSKIPAAASGSVVEHHDKSNCATATTKLSPQHCGGATHLISTVVGDVVVGGPGGPTQPPAPVPSQTATKPPPSAESFPAEVRRLHAIYRDPEAFLTWERQA